ncbi:hypothetical protein [Reinekea sp. G2M2-21]|uniref:hypothetical protein n=1 Tax=Reinekea sp. G2M2-21 TaxID=2788942 RepID=UPI0018AC5DB5|nr:hypothetical protein [Reinekea sp. G2M2-21]
MKKSILLVAFVFAFVVTNANAYESKSGVISKVEVFGEGNYAFRIRFQGNPSLCSLNEDWAYIESTDSNYDTKVSSLLSAFAMGATVSIFTEASSRNHCHLTDITGISK